jgi:tellurite resistance protein
MDVVKTIGPRRAGHLRPSHGRDGSGIPAPAGARHRVTANFFGIPLGLAGLAQCWTIAGDAGLVSPWTVGVGWTVTVATWVVVLVAYLWDGIAKGRLASEPHDPVFGPFTSAALLVPVMAVVPVADHLRPVAGPCFVVLVALGVGYGSWLTGQWLLSGLRWEDLHPGYFLPTVATGFVAAAATATLGHPDAARALFGYGAFGWVTLAPVLWARLFTTRPLPDALVPTLAIQIAPPVVAGNAWFAINAGQIDDVALLLAGYGVAMLVVQLRLVRTYVRLRFASGWWAFAFSYAAATAFGMHWLVIGAPAHRDLGLTALLALITCGIVALVARSVLALTRGAFVPLEARDAGPAPGPAAAS